MVQLALLVRLVPSHQLVPLDQLHLSLLPGQLVLLLRPLRLDQLVLLRLWRLPDRLVPLPLLCLLLQLGP